MVHCPDGRKSQLPTTWVSPQFPCCVLSTWQPASPRASNPRESKVEITFYKLDLQDQHCPFHLWNRRVPKNLWTYFKGITASLVKSDSLVQCNYCGNKFIVRGYAHSSLERTGAPLAGRKGKEILGMQQAHEFLCNAIFENLTKQFWSLSEGKDSLEQIQSKNKT